ncbi:MAG: DUF4112 domain-containing protein [Longimicrobiales bacterium]
MSEAYDSPREMELRRLDALAQTLDRVFRLPGTDIRFGLDPLLGLIPGAGDLLGGALSAYVVLVGARLGAPRGLLLRMLFNVGIDAVVGAVPVLGDLFDVAWRANTRNVALLRRYVHAPDAARRSSRHFVVAVIVVLAALVIGGIAVSVALVRWLAGVIG